MSSIIFKRLFEIQILHDYFLTTDEGISFFDMGKEDKKGLIAKKLTRGIYNINDFFEIEPLNNTETRISEYKLIVKNTALGILVGVEVDVESNAGEPVYKPRFEMDKNINLTFSIKPKIPFFKSITNINLRSKLPSIYYFTNKGKEKFEVATNPSFGTLPISRKALPHQNGKMYEMGAVVDFSGEIREALQYTDGSDANHWEIIEDRRIVSNADKILLPSKFNYTLAKEQNITQVEFILKDESDNEVKKINESGIEALGNIYLDFTKDEALEKISSGFYTLTIKENAGPEVAYEVYLNSEMYDRNYFGIIDIRFDELNSPYSLLDGDGFLNRVIDETIPERLHRVYELRFKNRKTYWRYNKEGDFTVDEKNGTSSHLAPDPSGYLISNDPKALTETLVPFLNGASLVLPTPKISSIKIEGEKIFSEIYINQSNRLLKN